MDFFKEVQPYRWRYIHYYKYKLTKNELKPSFMEEASILKEQLNSFTESNDEQIRKHSERLLENFQVKFFIYIVARWTDVSE